MDPLLCGLAVNPALPAELVDRLIALADADVDDELAHRAGLTRAQAITLASRDVGNGMRLAYEGVLAAGDVDPTAQPRVALALLDEGVGDPAWARLLAASVAVETRERLAACPGLPPDVVETLAADPDIRVVVELALWAEPDVAARLAGHPHAEVRRAVALNEATPPEVLAALVGGEDLPPARHCLVCDREEPPFAHGPDCPRLDCDLRPGSSCDGTHESTALDILRAGLENPATPAEVAAGFADHPSALLRRAVAARPGLPPQAYARLAADRTPGTRADLAANPGIDDALIHALADDTAPDVRRALAHNPRVPLDVLAGLVATTRIGATPLPRIASATAAEVEELARSPHAAVRVLPARRRDLPAGIRDALADDPDAKVVTAVAAHPGLSEARLHAMVDRHGVQVLTGAAANPDATPAFLERVARHRPPVRKALREIARHPRATAPALLPCLADERARPLAARHPALPPTVVVELLSDPADPVAEAAAANPSLPLAVMEELTARPAGRPAARPTEGPAARPTEGPAGRPTEGPAGRPTEGPAGRPTEGPAGRPAGRGAAARSVRGPGG
ncbi:hypothetical protein RM704_07515 [Streptomyces sp. DSM 3412]|uniref:Leucine rich repeat variant n=1 Tax=Streptomyces gottesmaniae TaxID=3075518 RepID=A0ABU2YSK2_9ACTN|nr:hypothetical protein [Streptomyces sp. DSM 3412]MDT0567310.1 hypothetical protein [Streptomyces sp. DSM 3412]